MGAVLDPALAAPKGLTDPEGRPAGKRFDVYRNNVAVSLTEALITAFPTIHKLVGDACFRALAGVFLRKHPPQSARMMFYGAEMPAFLAGFEPVGHLPYLSDIARLECALRESYHAADASPVDPADLQALPPERLMAARLQFAPAMVLLRSDWPIHGIWQANRAPAAPTPQMQPEDVLITRPEFDPEVAPLPPGGATFIATLQGANPFGAALEAAQAEAGDSFDLTALFGLLIGGNAITHILEDPQ